MVKKTIEKNKVWGSLEEFNQTEEFKQSLGKEFVNPPQEQEVSSMERRTFLKVMGASMLMASMASCRRPVEKVIPYVNKPDEVTLGIPNYYSSTCGECSTGCGLVVKTRESRPIKLEGNELHPLNQGALCARGQASILNLYYPGRLKGPVKNGVVSTDVTWASIDKEIQSALSKGNKKIYLYTNSTNSPSLLRLISDFSKKYSQVKHVAYDPLAPEELAMANELSFGRKVTPKYNFDQAIEVVSFGADFLGAWLSPTQFAKDFSKNRKVESSKMSKLHMFESGVSLTGTNADERHMLKSGTEIFAALALAHEIIVNKRFSIYAGDSSVRGLLGRYSARKMSVEHGFDLGVIQKLASSLIKNRGKSIVLGGSLRGAHAVELQVVVNLLNSALSNVGRTVEMSEVSSNQANSSYEDVVEMVKDMEAGRVGALIIADSNPVYNLPKGLGFEKALKKVSLKISTATMVDETAELVDYICPSSHYLESWADAEPYTGLFSVGQPVVSPLYQTRSLAESLMKWSGINGSWLDYLKSTWKSQILSGAVGFGASWNAVLEKGFFDKGLKDSSYNSLTFRMSALSGLARVESLKVPFALQLVSSVEMGDGRSANNAWLQELPDSLSKVTWDNYVSLSPKVADDLNLEEGDIVSLEGKGIGIELPAHIQPRLSHNQLVVKVGYGRKKVGDAATSYDGHDFGVIGEGVGVDVYPLQNISGRYLAWGGLEINRVVKTGKKYRLAITQGHHTLEGRDLVKETTYSDYQKDPSSGNHSHHKPMTMWSGHEYNGYKWGMAVDTTLCTGCNSCMVGCQSENNVPVVGKEQILMGRDMHWLRIDRYYVGDDKNDPEVSYQPVLCQQCENAPCETVCPVLATVHSEDGLNQMIYNRCVGTRYCANNCPYKVRRFNYFEYTGVFESKPLNYVLNPDVTVRSQGVMEKCTFCVQRIRVAKDDAKDRGSDRVDESSLKTACQQTCPSDAIVFGDLNDPKSKVSELFKSARSYELLEELNVGSRVAYLTKVRNKD